MSGESFRGAVDQVDRELAGRIRALRDTRQRLRHLDSGHLDGLVVAPHGGCEQRGGVQVERRGHLVGPGESVGVLTVPPPIGLPLPQCRGRGKPLRWRRRSARPGWPGRADYSEGASVNYPV